MDKRGVGKRILIFSIVLAIIIFGFLIKAENSESSTPSEWRMFRRYLNHTAWDGNTFTVVSGLNTTAFTTGSSTSWSSPAVANGYVYVGSEDGNLYQLNASNISKQINNYTVKGIDGSKKGIVSPPTVAGNFVYVAGTSTSYLFQLNATNLSHYSNSTFTASTAYPSAIIANGSAYYATSSLYQTNASNITQIFNTFVFPTGGSEVYSTPAVANGYIYAAGGRGTANNVFYQLNASNVSIQVANYTIEDGWLGRSSPVVWDKYVYFGTDRNSSGGSGGAIIQLNATNVSHKIATYNIAPDGTSSSPAIATIGTKTYLYVGATDDNLYQLNASNIAQKIANYSIGDNVHSSPTIANGYVYAGSNDGYMYQLNASNVSKFVGRIYAGSAIVSSPAYANGYIYFTGGANYKVYQVNASNLSLFTLVDLTPPAVTINVPQALPWTYSGTFSISVHMNEIGYCEYSINNGGTNYTLNTNDNVFFHGTSITIPDGIYTLDAYCNDTAGNRNDTETRIFTMYTSSSSGGGETTTTTTTTVPSVPAGEPTTVTITNPNIEVGGVTITTTENVSAVSITVKELNRSRLADFEIGVSTRQIYQALNISVSGLNNSQIANATVNFRVNISWVEDQRRATEEDVRLFRRNDVTGRWGALATTLLYNDSHYYYYSAITPGFSTFVIFYGRYDCEPGINRCFESQIQMCLGNATWLTTEKCTYGCGNEGVCFESVLQSKTFYTIIIALVSAGIVIGLYVVLARIFKKKRRMK